ncbi:17360_t:CDS:1 [Acaulospora colombiana]|uniref:17360_t:CDS:1 n=1 Tax=Acaulospora colombiana TaxID=27376 RepID=A0ACA9M2E2_9GLOM|nr:17360_t:CDS:1 [Acaulospora colombiana]
MTNMKLNTFPIAKLPFDLIENVLSFSIEHKGSKVIGSQLIYVCLMFAKAAIPHFWRHLYLEEPTQKKIFAILHGNPSKRMFNYHGMVKSVTICPVWISNMKSGGLLRTLDIVLSNLPNLTRIHIEDKLSFCHNYHLNKEATTEQLADLLCKKDLKELILDSDHLVFNDELLEIVSSQSRGLKMLSLNGPHFSDEGIMEYVIPNLKDDLVEFSAGHGGINPITLTGNTVLALLENCPKLKRILLEGVDLSDSDFIGEDLPLSNLEYLWLGKTSHQNFTAKGLASLLMTCNESLVSLVLDLSHVSSLVLQDIIIPLFQHQKLRELHLVSASWAEWSAYYPRPRSEHEVRAKEAMLCWKLKAYWGITHDLIDLIGEKIPTLKVFSILGENHLKAGLF